ncbi:hypothetical protein VNO78_20935 [Psophocarpus tetragonolobus]|uniref:Uncharacterized protein n=1 Tax=Psophocarpus tetragonolobus TaxID=3891 RepID=A0AAN9SCB8_PSOTE
MRFGSSCDFKEIHVSTLPACYIFPELTKVPMSCCEDVHLVFLPSAGMGHLNPCLRTASLFLRNGCKVTLVTPKNTVSQAETNLISRFCSSFPHQVTSVDLNLVPVDPKTVQTKDPFWLQFETIRRSVHLLAPILSSLSPPPSAFVFDVSLISPLLPIIQNFSFPSYIYFVSPARMLSLFAHLPVLDASNPGADSHPCSFIGDFVKIPGIESPILRSSIPPLLLEPNTLFEKIFMEDSPKLKNLNGILINSFEEIEGEALAALNEGKVVEGLPPVYGVGPLMAGEYEKVDEGEGSGCMGSILEWLDKQGEGSVVYVCMGNRTATRKEQIKDIALGLIECGYSFLWVVKLKVVDKEEEEDLEEVLGSELMKKVKEKGMVVKEYVDQRKILGHPGVGGFVNHGGWNSIMEAVWEGVPMLLWANDGDQKIASQAVGIIGVGIWAEEWGWGSRQVVNGKAIAKRINDMMSNHSLRIKAAHVKEAARRAAATSHLIVQTLIHHWNKGNAPPT